MNELDVGTEQATSLDRTARDTMEHEKPSSPVLPVVVKVLKPTYMSKIKREIKMLEILKGIPGVIQLYGATKNSGCRTVSLIFENIGSETQWLSHRATMLTSDEIQIYCYKLLKALDSCHARGKHLY
jgi:serine/threonine protein kinase